MIEGGGLGVFKPEEVGSGRAYRCANGVIDVLVRDEAEAVAVAKQYLSYFQGRIAEWSCADQRRLRHVVPENRLRGYDMRELIRILADEGSMLELRAGFGLAMITALIRVEGRPIGVIANNPRHLGGAIDSDAADKAARFMQLCDAHDIPLLSLNDNPGNMVGPEAEKTALIRHCCRSYLIGANLSVPMFLVCIRKSYGLGKLAMIGGGMRLRRVLHRLADRRVRRHGVGRAGEARAAQGAGGDRRSGGAPRRVRPDGRRALRKGTGDQSGSRLCRG